MSTLEDFENAPIGATAISPYGGMAFKTGRPAFEWIIFDSYWSQLDNRSSDEMLSYTLNPLAPTTAREARDLTWALAHAVKVGQVIPGGTRFLEIHNSELRETSLPRDIRVTHGLVLITRTFDSFSETEPDWLDAPAVLAATVSEDESEHRTVFVRGSKTGTKELHDGYWQSAHTGLHYPWQDLTDVTPLYPKEDAEPRTYSARLNYDGPWGTRLGGDPA